VQSKRRLRADLGHVNETDGVLLVLSEMIGTHPAVGHSFRCDPLTGLGNRRQYDERLPREVAAAIGSGKPLSLCLLALRGDRPGDDALCAVARILQSLRESDDAFRIGADEFAVLLPGTSLLGGRIVAERLADRIGSAAGALSASCGVAAIADPDPERLHAAAKAELARARPPLA
jgi:diguanylate cyclase (GGDEF)-like protein